MGSDRARVIGLAILIVVLAVVIWRQSTGDSVPGAPSTATTQARGRAGSAAGQDVARPVPVVALARLSRAAVEPSDTGRDPFRFSAVPTAPGRGGASGSAPQNAGLPPAVRVEAPSAPAGPPPPPPIPLKFIGVASRQGGVRVAMLTDGRGVYSGVEGSVIEGQYRIIRIGQDSIDVSYLDGRGRRTIQLSGS